MTYCILVHISILVMLLTLIYFFINDSDFNYGKIVAVVFFFNCLAIAINFTFVAKKLPIFLKSWDDFEAEFDANYPTKQNSTKTFYIFMCVAFMEHLFSKVEDYERASLCFDQYSTRFEAFSKSIIPKFFQVWPYSPSLGLYLIVTCFYSTVLWNFCDVFLISIFHVIYTKLRNFNRKMGTSKYDKKLWNNARRNYVGLHEQIKLTNQIISSLLMLSMLNDFYFICNQALNALKWVTPIFLTPN